MSAKDPGMTQTGRQPASKFTPARISTIGSSSGRSSNEQPSVPPKNTGSPMYARATIRNLDSSAHVTTPVGVRPTRDAGVTAESSRNNRRSPESRSKSSQPRREYIYVSSDSSDAESDSGWSQVNADDEDDDVLDSMEVEELISRPQEQQEFSQQRTHIFSASSSSSVSTSPRKRRSHEGDNEGTSISHSARLKMQRTSTFPETKPPPAPPKRPFTKSATLPTLPFNSQSRTPAGPSTISRTTNQRGPIFDPESPFNGSVRPPPFEYAGDVHSIAHNPQIQTLMDNANLAWGTQYEIARGVSDGRWKWEDVTVDKINRLKGTNVEAAFKVEAVIKGREPKGLNAMDHKLWAELDREQDALIENNSRGLGLQGEWQGVDNWYGGRIQQVLSIQPTSDRNEPYRLQLEKMEMKKSHRFARFLGSRRLLRIKLAEEKQADMLSRSSFVLCGRVFVPFCIKDKAAFLVEIDQDYERRPSQSQCDHLRMSYMSFIDWYNPLKLNDKQNVSKWVARFDLGLSTSVPVLRFEPGNIFLIDDHYAPHKRGEKPGPELIYTDGCGFMNAAALAAIAARMNLSAIPAAIQGRVFGSKGVWTLHPTEPRENLACEPRIWVRDSQLKIKLTKDWIADPNTRHEPRTYVAKYRLSPSANIHPAHLIFDLVQPSRVFAPSRLSKHLILNLDYNHVPQQVIIDLMKNSLDELIQPFTQWHTADAMRLLWNAVNKSGNVTSGRLQKEAAGLSRALGLSRRPAEEVPDDGFRREEEDESEGESDGEAEDPGFPWVGSQSKAESRAESVMELLQAGFTPLNNEYVFNELKEIIKTALEKFIKEYRISVAESAEAFIIPDPCGVLGEREIHFKSSQPLKDTLEGFNPNVLTGDVLIYRNPCRLPTDVQKVVAVTHPSLADYSDVIVLPTKGPCSFASLLAGGDMDGDFAVCIFNQDIVRNFNPPASDLPIPQDFLASNFESQDTIPKIATINMELSAMAEAEAQLLLQQHLLSGSFNDKIWRYSNFHENAVYAYGYGDARSIRNAMMFNTILDSRKSGLVVKGDVYEQDVKQYGRILPPCMQSAKSNPVAGNPQYMKRETHEPFILEAIQKEGQELHDQRMYSYHIRAVDVSKKDPHLLQPWNNVNSINDVNIQNELKLIKAHVNEVHNKWSGFWSTTRGEGSGKSNSRLQVAAFRREFLEVPSGVQILKMLGRTDVLAASYAYKDKKGIFAFAVASAALCKIKAESQLVPMTHEFASVMTIPPAAVRMMKAKEAESD
ncbi:hypothetical protein K474DRAFT_1655468 [Panus rudis PR-1116 ss-1]|nr:hypothetical protein K474DRAFT_1655468 [Panus rudis PR-1116 ss-1]